jgi:hypothetical protein
VLFCSWNYIASGDNGLDGRCYSISNGSQIILLVTDDPASDVRLATEGMDPSTAWLVIAYDEQGGGRASSDTAAAFELLMEVAADALGQQLLLQGPPLGPPLGAAAVTAGATPWGSSCYCRGHPLGQQLLLQGPPLQWYAPATEQQCAIVYM